MIGAAYISGESHQDTLMLNVERLDASNSDQIKVALREATADKTGDITLDMAKIKFVDSSGLGALVSLRKHLGESRQIRMINASESLIRIFHLTKLNRVFDI